MMERFDRRGNIMDLASLIQALRQDATWVVFISVLLQQIGLPVPAVPTLLVAGSLAATPWQAAQMLAAAVFASLLADAVWYFAGRAFGYRVLAGLCKLSINPASCVSQTEQRFVRWGMGSLVIAKFIPGFSTVAPPIAGALRMNLTGFLFAAAAGAGLWSGLAIGVGWLFRSRLQTLLVTLSTQGTLIVGMLLAAVALWLGWKFWQKYRFERLAAIPHATPLDLLDAMNSPRPPRLLDLRGAAMEADLGPIAGAISAEYDDLLSAVAGLDKDHPIVTLCACPADAGAVSAARKLMAMGYTNVRPLKGGYEAYIAAQSPAG